MPDYQYIAVDPSGQEVSGEITAPSVTEGVATLESRGLSVQSITATDYGRGGRSRDTSAVRFKPALSTPSSLDQYLQAVVERRSTILPPLEALVKELPSGRARREIEKLIQEVAGARDCEDLRRSERTIRWLPLLSSGFSADSSARRLGDLIAYSTRDLQNRLERQRLMAYPILVMLACAVVLGFLCMLVVPTFEKMFDEFGIRLPWPTYVLVEVTRQFHFHSLRTLLWLVVIAGSVFAMVRLWTRFAMTTRLFGFAVSGNSASLSAMSSLTGQLAELLQIGVSVPDAIWISGRGCDHHYFQKASEQLARDAYSRTSPLRESTVANIFPANMIHALEGGERGPNLTLLRELSSMYASRVHRRVDWSTGAMTQIAIVVLGAAIGFLVIALFMPLLSLITSLS